MRTIVVGDVHGCLEELDELLRVTQWRPGERLVLAGDLVDRGPDPVGVVRRARELGARSVMGNHDEKHIRFRRHDRRVTSEPGYRNPMRPFRPDRMAEHLALSEEDWAYLEAMPLFLRIDPKWVVVHAGLLPGIAVEEQKPNVLLRMRHIERATSRQAHLYDKKTSETHAYWSELWTGPENVVHGHHVVEAPSIVEPVSGVKCVGIDTGCCFGQALTAFILFGSDLFTFESVSAKREYQPYTEYE